MVMHTSNELHCYLRQRYAPYIYVYIIYIYLYLNNKSQYGGILFPNLIHEWDSDIVAPIF